MTDFRATRQSSLFSFDSYVSIPDMGIASCLILRNNTKSKLAAVGFGVRPPEISANSEALFALEIQFKIHHTLDDSSMSHDSV